MIKVRFHLGRGENYRHWQVTKFPKVDYVDPGKFNLILKNCRLKNIRKIADKIFNGQNKDVCSWIVCDEVLVTTEVPNTQEQNEISYNPKLKPFWTDFSGNDIDGSVHKEVVSLGKKLYYT